VGFEPAGYGMFHNNIKRLQRGWSENPHFVRAKNRAGEYIVKIELSKVRFLVPQPTNNSYFNKLSPFGVAEKYAPACIQGSSLIEDCPFFYERREMI